MAFFLLWLKPKHLRPPTAMVIVPFFLFSSADVVSRARWPCCHCPSLGRGARRFSWQHPNACRKMRLRYWTKIAMLWLACRCCFYVQKLNTPSIKKNLSTVIEYWCSLICFAADPRRPTPPTVPTKTTMMPDNRLLLRDAINPMSERRIFGK